MLIWTSFKKKIKTQQKLAKTYEGSGPKGVMKELYESWSRAVEAGMMPSTLLFGFRMAEYATYPDSEYAIAANKHGASTYVFRAQYNGSVPVQADDSVLTVNKHAYCENTDATPKSR